MRGRDAEVCINLAETLDDHDDVQTVYSDFDIPDPQRLGPIRLRARRDLLRLAMPRRRLVRARRL